MPFCKWGHKRDFGYLVNVLPGIDKGRVAALMRRLFLDNFHQLILCGFSCFRVTVPPDGEDGIPDVRQSDAIRGTVRLRQRDADWLSRHSDSSFVKIKPFRADLTYS